jgi:hypothetical protein
MGDFCNGEYPNQVHGVAKSNDGGDSWNSSRCEVTAGSTAFIFWIPNVGGFLQTMILQRLLLSFSTRPTAVQHGLDGVHLSL